MLVPFPGPLFWSEHSERHVLPSIAAAQQIPKDDRDYLGRWGINAKQSGEYILTARHVITGMQATILGAISGSILCRYDEEELLRAYWEWLEKRDPFLDAHDFVKRLGMGSEGDPEDCCLNQPWPLIPGLAPEIVLVDDEAGSVPVEEMLNVATDERREPRPGEDFWVSISRSGFRRLHRVGKCTVDRFQCNDWKYLSLPQATEQKSDKPCLLCWPEMKAQNDSDDSDSCSSSESSSSSENEAGLVVAAGLAGLEEGGVD